jgi:hypothetical protein
VFFVSLPLSYLLKSSQRNDSKEKNMFDVEYVTEYSVQSLAETFLNPRNFLLDIVKKNCVSFRKESVQKRFVHS